MRISNKKDLPSWFSLKNYDSIHQMDDCDFMHQIIFRFFNSLDGIENNTNYFNETVKVFSSACSEESCSKGGRERVFPEQMIATDVAVKPLNINDVLRMKNYLEYHGYDTFCHPITGYDLDSYEKNDNIHFNVASINECEGKLHCELDLYCDDEVIITSLSRLLPLWRRQLAVEIDTTDSEIKTSWPINKQKMVSYKIFAFYDLIRWQAVTGCKVTNSVMAAALYPNGEYGETAINQTIKKYVENVFDKNYIRNLITELHKKGVGPFS